MASFVIMDPVVVMAGADIGGFLTAAEINIDVLEEEIKYFDTKWVILAPGGIKAWSMTLDVNQDFDAGAIDGFLFARLGNIVPISVKHRSGPTTSNNPAYEGMAKLLSYPPFQGGVGELATGTIVLRGSGEISRVTQ